MPLPTDRIMTQSEALEEAKQRLGDKARVTCHFGTFKIGYAAPDGSLVVVGRGRSWEQAFRDSFGIIRDDLKVVGGEE